MNAFEPVLTVEERELIQAFRKADSRGKLSILDQAKSMAEDWPAPVTEHNGTVEIV